MIDRDCKTWTLSKLQEIKRDNEEFARNTLGIPSKAAVEVTKYSCDFAGNCSATIAVQSGADVYWNVRCIYTEECKFIWKLN